MGTTLTTVEAERIFGKLKMQVKRNSYHVRGYFYYEDRLIAVAQYSHGNKSLPGRVPLRFSQSLFLTPSEFIPMRKCKTTLVDYIQLLKQKGKIL